MQSIPRILQSSFKQLIRPSNDKPNTISVIPQIATPNQILPKQLLLSKPASHLFVHNFYDIESSSGSLQPLYEPEAYGQNEKTHQKFFSLNQDNNQTKFSSPSNKNRFRVNKLLSLKDFFLQQSENIAFISRTVCFALKQTQVILFRKLINTSKQNLTESLSATEYYFEGMKKLSNILLDKQKFPFLCPQLNQTITQKQSLNNVLLQSQSNDFLSFDDNFECSNILMVKQFKQSVNSPQIHCICTRFDFQTASYGQWFYFSVKRWSHQLAPKRKQKFIICNMTKRYSMLGLQMKISVCRNGIWTKQGQNIRYYETSFKRGNKLIDVENLTQQQTQKLSRNHQFYFALEFDLELQPNQEIVVSYNEPYSLSKLSKLLDSFSKVFDSHLNKEAINSNEDTTEFQTDLKSKEFVVNTKPRQHQIFFKRQIVCQTPLKNQIECLTFSMKKQTAFNRKQISDNESFNSKQEKKIIFIMARAHPIETAGSFVLDGFMRNLFLFLEYKNDRKRKQQLQDFFQSQNKGALLQNLLDKFAIKIIPMINPDGVIIGNSRCNFYGLDLNRQWKRSNKNYSQEVFSLKRFLLKFKDRIEMVIDLHGHSKERNVFAYGMHDFKNPFSTRQFPYILSKITQQNFLFDKCRFTRLSQLKPKVDPLNSQQTKENVKQGTARIWLFRKLQIPNIFTIENSYCSSIYSKFHYDSQTYGKIGKEILLGICFYFINYSDQNQIKQKVDKSKKKKKVNGEKSFQEDRVNGELPSTILTIHDLRSFKDSILFDLQSKQQNATMGIESINSSESQEQRRIEDQIIQKSMVITKKQMPASPNKSRSHHSIKKAYDQKLSTPPTRISRYPTTMQDEEKPYNFKLKLTKAESPLIEQERSSNNKIRESGKNLKQKSRYMSSEAQRLKELSCGKRSPTNHKSTIELQKNVTLSIVELGFENVKLMDLHSNSQRRNNESPNNMMVNFPHINSGNHMLYPHNHYHNSLLNNRINQKLHHNLLSNSQNGQLKSICRKPSQTGATTDMLQKLQQRRNVTEFMKKIESSRKLQNDLVTTKKIGKYKEIIMKINGNNKS